MVEAVVVVSGSEGEVMEMGTGNIGERSGVGWLVDCG